MPRQRPSGHGPAFANTPRGGPINGAGKNDYSIKVPLGLSAKGGGGRGQATTNVIVVKTGRDTKTKVKVKASRKQIEVVKLVV